MLDTYHRECVNFERTGTHMWLLGGGFVRNRLADTGDRLTVARAKGVCGAGAKGEGIGMCSWWLQNSPGT